MSRALTEVIGRDAPAAKSVRALRSGWLVRRGSLGNDHATTQSLGRTTGTIDYASHLVLRDEHYLLGVHTFWQVEARLAHGSPLPVGAPSTSPLSVCAGRRVSCRPRDLSYR